jgi:hypothetical protein
MLSTPQLEILEALLLGVVANSTSRRRVHDEYCRRGRESVGSENGATSSVIRFCRNDSCALLLVRT